jgi:hypothetical protein
MREDREELFGRSSASPIDVDDHAPHGGAGGLAVAGAGDGVPWRLKNRRTPEEPADA